MTGCVSLQRISFTVPSSGASTGISIFMLSMMTRMSPGCTASPSFFSIAHPARKNAVDAAVLARIAAETARATADGVRAIVLMGEGADFCSGYDLNAVEAWDPLDLAAELPDAPLGRACAALEAAGPPVIAAVEGVAFGAGCELACACDFRVASSKARFSIPPARLGIVYSAEGAARILRLVGLQAARSLFLRVDF